MDVIWLNRNPSIRYTYRPSIRRAVNNVLVGLQARLRTRRVVGYPRHLIVDLVNVCGLACPICPNGRGEIPRQPGIMMPSLFASIMKTMGPYLYTLTLTNWGEPLRHPQLLDLLAIARSYPCYIGFSSNLQHLPDSLLDGLIRSGIDEIGISIDGATAATYNHYRIGGDFNTALTNLKRLVTRRRELGSITPKIRWQVLLNRYTEPETGAVEALAREIGVDSVMFIPIFIDISRMFTHTPAERLARDRHWLPRDPDMSFYDTDTGRLKGDPRFCNKIWDTMVIHPDGAVSPCCAVIDPADDFGRLTEGTDFNSIWNGPSYRMARSRMAGRRSDEGHIVCDHCLQNGVLIL
ncbi:SPASM domain-containing protein [bacterium]|nr:SPASM domain-containing protein [candidate division CSSED10-310 bacterium]